MLSASKHVDVLVVWIRLRHLALVACGIGCFRRRHTCTGGRLPVVTGINLARAASLLWTTAALTNLFGCVFVEFLSR